MPSDHLRTLLEFLRIAGPGGADLMRRWSAALLAVPPEEREAAVAAVERRVVDLYGGPAPESASRSDCGARIDEQTLHIAEPPVERDGFVEQTIRTYAATPAPGPGARPAAKPARKATGA